MKFSKVKALATTGATAIYLGLMTAQVVLAADGGEVKSKLTQAGKTIQGILTGLVVLVGICVALFIIIKRMPDADDPREKSEVYHEIPSIKSHLMNTAKKNKENHEYNRTFSMFLADKIAKGDVADQVAFIKHRFNVNIYLWESSDYVEFSKNVKSLDDYAVIRPYRKMSKRIN